MNLLVGATGFIGSNLAEFLFEKGEICKATFRKGSYLKTLDKFGIQCIETNFEHETLHEALEEVETVYFLAYPSVSNEERDFVARCKEFVSAVRESNVRNVVYMSTIEVYRDINGVIDTSGYTSMEYMRQRIALDELFLSLRGSANVSIVRSAMALGKYDRSFTKELVGMIMKGEVVMKKFSKMSFSNPKDIANAMYQANGKNEVVNVKSFDASTDELVTEIARNFGMNVKVRGENIIKKSNFSHPVRKRLERHLFLKQEDTNYKPLHDLTSTCNEIYSWYSRKSF